MRTEFVCISAASGPRVKLASCISALTPPPPPGPPSPMVCSTDRSKAVVPVLVLLFVALWFILRGDLLYVFPCVILFLCVSVLLVLRLPRLGKRELISYLFWLAVTLLTVVRRWTYSLLLCGLFYEVTCFISCVILLFVF